MRCRLSAVRVVLATIIGLIVAFSMEAQNKAITLQLPQSTLKEAIIKVAKEGGLSVSDPSNLLVNKSLQTDLSFHKKPLDEAIRYLLYSQGLTFEIAQGELIIRSAKSGVLIQGEVHFEDGSPAVGATILLDDKRYTIADQAGKFTCRLPQKENLIISAQYVGMTPTDHLYKGEEKIHLLLKESVLQIDDVVVTGYQVINKRKWTGSSTTIKPEEILTPSTVTIDQALVEGVVPDMMVLPTGGEVGAVPKLRIRGTSTVLGVREPLWVIDGVVQRDPISIRTEDINDPDFINRVGNAISGLNPQDIERIDILKDAASTALYGAQAANGVIVITTKKGQEGDMKINYSGSMGVTQRPRYSDSKINLMNSKERVQFSRELIESNYYFPSDMYEVGYEHLVKELYNKHLTFDEFQKQVSRIETINTDWFALLMNDALRTNHNISASGSTGKTSYYASLGYNLSQGVVKGDKTDRTSAFVKLITDINPRNKLSFWIRTNFENRQFVPTSINPTNYAYNTSRAIPAYDEFGQLSFYKIGNSDERYRFNILNEIEHSGYEQQHFSTSINGVWDTKLTDHLSGHALLSFTTSNSNGEEYWDEHTYHVSALRRAEFGDPFTKVGKAHSLLPYGGEVSTFQERYHSMYGRFLLNYGRSFENESYLSANLGLSLNSTRSKGSKQLQRGYFKDYGEKFIGVEDIDAFPEYKNWLVSTDAQPQRMNDLLNQFSLFSTLSYSFPNSLTLSLNARTDASNRFGDRSNNKFLPIWSVSGSYDFSTLLPDKSVVNYLFLRSSYGVQGNMLRDQSPEPIIKRFSIDPYYNEEYVKLERYPNPNLKWEKTRSFSSELDFALFDNRVAATISYYRKKTIDAFLNINIDLVNGYPSYVVNSGDLRNSGFSVAAMFVPIKSRDFQWRIHTSFSKNFNSLITKPEYSQFAVNDFLRGTAHVEGKPLGTFYSYRFKGLSHEDGGPLFYDLEEQQEELYGLSNFEVYSRVLEESGNRYPTMQGGFRNSITYKDFTVRFNLAYSIGAKTRLFKLYNRTDNFAPEMNVNTVFMERWRKPGDELTTNIPAVIDQMVPAVSDKYNKHYSFVNRGKMPIIAYNAWDMYNFSDIRVVSADYLKCTDFSLSYRLGDRLKELVGIKNVYLTFSTNNLFLITAPELKGQTPVQGGFTEVNLSERPQYTFQLSFSL